MYISQNKIYIIYAGALCVIGVLQYGQLLLMLLEQSSHMHTWPQGSKIISRAFVWHIKHV